MNEYFLAIDIGASSGRHILGSIGGNKMVIEEIYRFDNSPVNRDGRYFWDTNALFDHIIAGIKKCKELNKIPVSVGIDTWGVDYALLDMSDKLIGDVFCYRDSRSLAAVSKVHEIISFEELYFKTGISFNSFNTIYQLYDDKINGRLDKANSFLMLPDYFHFLLTGVKRNEYTNATTSGMVNAKSKEWDIDIINRLIYPKKLFNHLSLGSVVGDFSERIQKIVGFNARVMLPCTHDTASAVAALPNTERDNLYISSGTWSLMGVELVGAVTSKQSCKLNYTNEGGYGYKYRYLKNITGLWLLQRIRHEAGNRHTFAELTGLAQNYSDFPSLINVNDNRFLAPENMTKAIKEYCAETGQRSPKHIGEAVFCIYNSLAKAYGDTAKEIERLTKKTYNKIHIMGGGSKNKLLNELTAKFSGKKIFAGPIEATAIGNIIVQMIANKKIKNISMAREIVRQSFEISEV